MLLAIDGTYFDGTQGDGDVLPPKAPLSIPRQVDAIIRVSVWTPKKAPVDLTKAGVSSQLTIKRTLDAGSGIATIPAQPIAGTVQTRIAKNVVDFAVTAQMLKLVDPGLLYFDVVAIGLSAAGSRDQIIGASALRLLPIVGAISGT